MFRRRHMHSSELCQYFEKFSPPALFWTIAQDPSVRNTNLQDPLDPRSEELCKFLLFCTVDILDCMEEVVVFKPLTGCIIQSIDIPTVFIKNIKSPFCSHLQNNKFTK